MFLFISIFKRPSLNLILTLLLTNFLFKAATVVAQAAVPQALVSPAPLSQTLTDILFLSILSYMWFDISDLLNEIVLKYENKNIEKKIKEKIYFIHISTDCVFSGKDGNYDELGMSDAEDLYGKSKIVGEILGNNKSVIRSSIIGPEQGSGRSLLNWFLNNESHELSGYRNHLWNGVTTLNLSLIHI